VSLLFVDDGKYGFAFMIVPGINTYAVFGTVVTIPGFSGGFPVIEYPADFEFPLRGNEGRILEYS
jgi:hypothetical protein